MRSHRAKFGGGLGLWLGLVVGCSQVKPTKSHSEVDLSTVRIDGALYQIMHEGKVGRNIDLSELQDDDTVFALGALENLSGEVTVLDGDFWLATPNEKGEANVRVVREPKVGATLLVSTKVSKWHEVVSDESLAFKEIDNVIRSAALKAGLDVQEPFVFKMIGNTTRLNWHVIDGRKIPEGVHGHEAHMATAVTGTLEDTEVELLGFYSPKHHRIFTHHDTNSHLHVVARSARVSGHVDYVDLKPPYRLFFPVVQRK